MIVRAYIGFGSNLGDLKSNFEKAKSKLSEHPQIQVLRQSQLYKTEPLTPKNETQPWYLNAVLEIQTSLTLHKLFIYLQQIERAMGRLMRRRWASRIVDLDILFYGDIIYMDKDLKIPHKEICNRNFVLKPLCDLIPDFEHPDLEIPLKNILAHTKDALKVEELLD